MILILMLIVLINSLKLLAVAFIWSRLYPVEICSHIHPSIHPHTEEDQEALALYTNYFNLSDHEMKTSAKDWTSLEENVFHESHVFLQEKHLQINYWCLDRTKFPQNYFVMKNMSRTSSWN